MSKFKPGQIVRDTSAPYPMRYLIGKTGFTALVTGTEFKYDSTFDGLGFFDDPAFVLDDPFGDN